MKVDEETPVGKVHPVDENGNEVADMSLIIADSAVMRMKFL